MPLRFEEGLLSSLTIQLRTIPRKDKTYESILKINNRPGSSDSVIDDSLGCRVFDQLLQEPGPGYSRPGIYCRRI